MPTLKKVSDLFETEEGIKIEQALRDMVANARYSTESSYSANEQAYPDKLIPFVDKHMRYLSAHKNVNLEHYLSNLRLMTRIK